MVLLAGGRGLAQGQPASSPDSLTRARQHFDRAQSFYNEGRYEQAIVEYLAAYRIKPHPAGLYNIGQAHERLLRYTEAVAWFERYLREAGANAPMRIIVTNRLRVLRDLPARIHVDCVPRARATLIDADGVVQRGETPHVFKVRAGRYSLRVDRAGHVGQERRIVADIGQPYFHQFTLELQRELVTIRPRPERARVFLDRKLVSVGLFADRLPVGAHSLLVEHGNHRPYQADFTLRPGHRLEYQIVLKPPPPQGRVELVAALATYGALAVPLGLHAGGVLASDDTALIFSSAVGGGGLFALGGLYATRGGVKQADVSLLTAGAAWGGVEGLALGLLTDHGDQRLLSGLTVASSLVGVGTTLLLLKPVSPTPGQAAILHSGGLWGTGVGLGLGYAIRGNERDLDLTLLIGVNVGLIAGGALMNHVELSRMRMFLIDLGGLAGSAFGAAIGYATAGTTSDPTASDAGKARLARGALIGGATGLVVAAIMTRNYDRSEGTVARDSLVSLQGGQLRLGVPMVATSHAAGDRRVSLSLLSGDF